MRKEFKMDPNSLALKISEYLVNERTHFNGYFYQNLCKQAAELYFKSGAVEDGIFYLSESRAAFLRKQYLDQKVWNKLFNEEKSTTSIKLDEKYLSFRGTYFEQKYEGLLTRLNEMPKEWTLIQIDMSFEPSIRWQTNQPNSCSNISDLHIVRYSCGDSKEPCHIFVPISKKNGQDLLERIHEITYKSWMNKSTNSVLIRKLRTANDKLLKSTMRDFSTFWLKEWRVMLLGKLESIDLENVISTAINHVFSKCKAEISSHDKIIIHQIANGCAHLSDDEVESAVSQMVSDETLRENLLKEIIKIKNEHSNLITARRLPVILMLDEKLECISWEVTSILRIHPVSRIPSIHFVHALFKQHQKSIVKGNKIVSNCENIYYLINPDQNLESTEKKMASFIHTRFPKWQGFMGKAPTKIELIQVLSNHELFLYCGHGNGTQFLSGSQIAALNLQTIPLLFGCSSLRYKNLGGPVNMISLSHEYLIAGSPCIFGTLWPITNHDADCMAIALLNHWLPGKPVDLKKMDGFLDDTIVPSVKLKEPELLRAIKIARDVAILFSNSASLVVYGLPTEIK